MAKNQKNRKRTWLLVALMAVFVLCSAESCNVDVRDLPKIYGSCSQFNSCPK